jgi:von Willebrand factor type A domain-containing protein
VHHPRPLISLLATTCLLACTAGTNSTNSPGTGGGNGGTSAAGSAGTSGGGQAGGTSGTAGVGGINIGIGGGGGMPTCGLQNFEINLEPPEMIVVLDRSETMGRNLMNKDATAGEPTKWGVVIPSLKTVIQQSRPDMSWGLKLFPQDGGECVNASLTNLIDIAVAPGSHAAVVAKAESEMPIGDGTPTGAAIAVAADHLRSLASTRRKFILLVTDGQPSCTGRPGNIALNTGDPARMDAVAAVTAALQAGFPTFVIGVATTVTNDVSTLNALATAGGKPACPGCPLATQFYDGSSQQKIQEAFADVADAAAACIFPLSSLPPVPDKVGVYVGAGMAKAPRNGTDGWEYTDTTHSTVQVYGSWCDMIKTAGANMVKIIFGCPGIEVP